MIINQFVSWPLKLLLRLLMLLRLQTTILLFCVHDWKQFLCNKIY